MATFLIEIQIPAMGATVNELTVIDLKAAAGSAVTKGQVIAELESDKSAFDFQSPADGTIEAVLARAADILPVGTALFRLRTADETLRHLEVKAGASPAVAPSVPAPPASQPSTLPSSHVTSHLSPLSSPALTPRAAKLASEAGLSDSVLSSIKGTGPGGRLSGEDVERFLAANPSARASAAKVSAPQTAAASFNDFSAETVCVAGIGHAVPNNIRDNKEILKAFPDMTEDEVVKLTGIRERRYAGPDETATSLAAQAVRLALAQARLAPSDIDGVIMATLIPDQPVPSMASALAKLLGIKAALAFDMNAACSGWLYALEVGRAFIRGGTAKKLIVVTAELLSRITNPKDHTTAFLFGDGAGAVVLTDDAGGHRLGRMDLSGDAENFDAIRRTGGGATRIFPRLDWLDRDDFYLRMDGAVVFKSAVRAFADLIEATMARQHLKPEEIAWVVPHQANERILRAVSKRVGIPYERFVVTIAKYGNTSAASVSMALGWAASEGIFRPGDKIIFCSVGAGLTFAGGLLTW